MKADNKTTTEVIAVLNKMSAAYERRDIGSLLATMAPDPDVIMFGTGVDEKRVGLAEIRAQAERDWAQTDAASLQLASHSVSAAGSVAWVAADATFNLKVAGEELTIPGRMTAVLEKREDRWLFVQSHFSVPMAGQAEGESFPAT